MLCSGCHFAPAQSLLKRFNHTSWCYTANNDFIYMLSTMHSFVRTSGLAYVMACELLQFIISATYKLECLSKHSGHYTYMYANIETNNKLLLYFLITLLSMHALTLCNEFASKQEKTTKKGLKFSVKINHMYSVNL